MFIALNPSCLDMNGRGNIPRDARDLVSLYELRKSLKRLTKLICRNVDR